MRYIVIPAPALILDALTGNMAKNPAGEPRETSFAWAVRMATILIANRGTADAQTLRDIRSRFHDGQRAGEVVALSDDEWRLLEPEFRRPQVPNAFGADWVLSAEDHQRAWLEAKVERSPVATCTVTVGGRQCGKTASLTDGRASPAVAYCLEHDPINDGVRELAKNLGPRS